MVPSGRHFVAGFTDGTLRLFDLTGHFSGQAASTFGSSPGTAFQQPKSDDYDIFDSDSSDDDDDGERVVVKAGASTSASVTASSVITSATGGTTALVCSKHFQRYGTVACQIHAKGVHTSLQMTVAVSPDGLWAFGGVARGSMELVAVHLAKLEEHHEKQQVNGASGLDMLDLMDVHRHADAKLRGFGACTRLINKKTINGDDDPTYLLLTGQGIKNIHIWSFRPSMEEWQCLYDTQSNGNSISLLHLRYSPSCNKLQAISKSDNQKLRVWDLSYEQGTKKEERPKKPPYKDISGTEATIGIGGDFGFGGSIHEHISLTNLEAEAPYNLTELALPARTGAPIGGGGRVGGRRQQRGELKSLHQVAGMSTDGSHVLLEMSDQSVVHFSFVSKSLPRLETLPIELTDSNATDGSRTISLARIGSEGITVATMASTFNSKGSIVVRQIGDASSEGYWGFHGVGPSKHRVQQLSSSPQGADSEAIAQAAGSAVNLFATKSKKQNRNKKQAVEDSGLIVPGPPSFSSTKTPASKRHTIIPDSTAGTPPEASVPASALKDTDSSRPRKSRPLGSEKKLQLDGAAVSPESHATPREKSIEDAARQLHHLQSTIPFKKKKKKKKKLVVEPTGEDKENDKPQGTKRLILHIRRPNTELDSEPVPKSDSTSQAEPGEKAVEAGPSVKSTQQLKKKVEAGSSVKSTQQLKTKVAISVSEISTKSSVETKRELVSVPSKENWQPNKVGALRPGATSESSTNSGTGEKKKKALSVATKDYQAKLKPPALRAISEPSMKSSAPERKRKATPLNRAPTAKVSPAIFVAGPPPKKKSRTVVANLGNVETVNLAPHAGWKLQSISKRFESFSAKSTSDTEDRRIKLVLEHRATHEMIRRKVLEAVTQLMQGTSESDSPTEEVKSSLENALARYSEMLVSCDASM
jgi:hypothetical protein